MLDIIVFIVYHVPDLCFFYFRRKISHFPEFVLCFEERRRIEVMTQEKSKLLCVYYTSRRDIYIEN